MRGNHFSVILLPTNKCNVNCDYCFEDKTRDNMSMDRLSILIDKVLDHMERSHVGALTIYWQGGEIMTMPPRWFEQAYKVIQSAALARNKHVQHSLQTNMIGYNKGWDKIIAEMFGNSVGTSMDYPNLHRKMFHGGPDDYTRLWYRNVQAARAAGIDISVIAVANQGTLAVGAERFYSYFVDELVKQFIDGAGCLPCIWQKNCADEFISIDARGYVAQCDCWVTSYPEYFFGNIFESDSLTELLKHSPARKKFLDRPSVNIQQDCLECDYLSICHGGCPVRTYTFSGTLFEKDPYCHLYKSLFRYVEDVAATLARGRAINPSWKAPATSCGGKSCGTKPAAAGPSLVQLESSWSASGGAKLRELPVLQ